MRQQAEGKTMTFNERTKLRAELVAAKDFRDGKTCDPTRYAARPWSAWANWYTGQYTNLAAVSPEQADERRSFAESVVEGIRERLYRRGHSDG